VLKVEEENREHRSAVNVLAGMSRDWLGAFLLFGGRLVWMAAYLWPGYRFGAALEVAADLVASLSGLVLSLAALMLLAFTMHHAFGRSRATASGA
jgi:membrane protein DedA with SNARE-associated domain